MPLRHALEVRHESFRDPAFVALLRRHGIGLVVADTAGKWPLLEDVTAPFIYVRLHGDKALYPSGYDDTALDGWARRIDAWRRGAEVHDARRIGGPDPARAPRDVYVYFDNDIKVHAPFDALRLAERLGSGRHVPLDDEHRWPRRGLVRPAIGPDGPGDAPRTEPPFVVRYRERRRGAAR
jgi:uncharacterized protein YecE (DUF72 family)